MITEDWQAVLGEGLAVTLELPVAATVRMPTTSDAAAHLLDAIAVLEAGSQGQASDELLPPEFVRLELKLDLLMDLVTTLLADKIPRRVPVTLSREGLVLPATALAADCERIELYPCQWLAQPLVLEIGRIKIRGHDCGAVWRSPDHGLKEVLGRWVFRMHRREVAQRRLHAAGDQTDRSDSGAADAAIASATRHPGIV